MTQDSTTMPRLAAEAFTDEDGATRLRITACRSCAARWFPPLATCANCAGTDLAPVVSGEHGTVYASTVVRVAPQGFVAPYVLSYVDIDGVRVLAHTVADAALPPGTPVRLETGQVGLRDGGGVESYRVRPVAAEPGKPSMPDAGASR